MGAFDDLIPTQKNKSEGGAFDDLIPQSETPQPSQPTSVREALMANPNRLAQQVKSLPGFLSDQWNQLSPTNQAIVGATAGSLFAPASAPFIGAQALKHPVINTLWPILQRVGGAGIGGFTGRATGELQQNPEQGTASALKKGLESGGDMATLEVGGHALGPIIEKGLAPFAKSISPEMRQVVEFAEKQGIPISPSAVVPTNVARAIEGVTEFLLPGKLTNDMYRKRAVERFNQLASEEIPQMVGTVKPSAEVNSAATREFARLYDELERGSKGMRNEFLQEVGHTTQIKAAKASEVYNKILRSSNDATLRDFATQKLAQMEKGKVRAEDLDRAYSQAGRLKPKGDIDLVSDIKNAIKEDFRSTGKPIDKFVEANETFRTKFGLFAGKAKSIEAALRKGQEPASLARDLFRGDNPALVKYARENMDPEVFTDLLTENISLMLRDSAVVGQASGRGLRHSQRLPEQLIFDGQKLETIISRNMPTLKAAGVTDETISALKNFAALNKLMKKDISKFEGSGSIANTMLTRGWQAGSGYYADMVPLVFGSMGTAALAKSLMQPNGALRIWLTRGASEGAKATAKEGLKIGGRQVFENGED